MFERASHCVLRLLSVVRISALHLSTKIAPRKSDGLFSSPEKQSLVLCLVLAAITLLLYNPGAHHDFVNYDDDRYVVDHPHVHNGLTWDTITWAFGSTQEANWHPLTWLSHALDYQLFHLNPAGHHYTSVILHALNVVLLFLILEKATGCTWRSLMLATVFAVHPINVESVAWIAERKNLLCTFFFLLGLGAYGWYVRKPSVQRYAAVAAFFALGVMSKPMVITFPFVLLLVDYWPLERMKRGNFGRLLLEKLPLLALSAASVIITIVAQKSGGAVRSVIEYSLGVRLENAIVAYILYLGKAIRPVRLAAMYPHPADSLPAWEVAGCALLLAVITAAVLYLRRPYLVVSWFWYLGTMVPVIGLVQVGSQAMADRYAYIPFMGIFVMIVWGVADLASKRGLTRWAAATAVLVVMALSAAAYVQTEYWKDSSSLWSHALAVTDRNFVAHDNLGNALVSQGRFDEAVAQFRAAADINPRDPLSALNIGAYDQQHGNYQGAIRQYDLVLRLTSDPLLQANAYANSGSAYRKLHDYARASDSFQAALKINPNHPVALTGLGLIAERSGDPRQAANYYLHAVSSQPSGVGYVLLGRALEQTGHPAEARAAYADAEKISKNIDEARRSADGLLAD